LSTENILGISRVIVTCISANPLAVEGHSKKCHFTNTSQIREEVQMPLDVSSQAEDGGRKVQNMCDDNGDVYLETATKESLFVRAKKKRALCYRCAGCGLCVHENYT
jgi:hypothetical protein